MKKIGNKIAKVTIEKLVFPHEEKPALKNIDFEINQGDFIVITGGSLWEIDFTAFHHRRYPSLP